MIKYPSTERVTAASLLVGERILIRERGSDRLPLKPVYPETQYGAVPTGTHEVAKVSHWHRRSGRKYVRYYDIELIDVAGGRCTAEVSSVQRLNRITS
jgi:hypothetical protein